MDKTTRTSSCMNARGIPPAMHIHSRPVLMGGTPILVGVPYPGQVGTPILAGRVPLSFLGGTPILARWYPKCYPGVPQRKDLGPETGVTPVNRQTPVKHCLPHPSDASSNYFQCYPIIWRSILPKNNDPS